MEAEYDILLTQRLVLQPRMKLEIAAQVVEEYDTYAGFTGIELDACGCAMKFLENSHLTSE